MAEPYRRTARVLVLAGKRVLLLKTHWYRRLDAPRWFTPGGGIEAGETEREAAARELFEETGQQVDPAELIGPIWHARLPNPKGHRFAATDATYFLWRTERFEVSDKHWEPAEHDDILAVQWWKRRAIDASTDVFSHEHVASMMDRLRPGSPKPGAKARVIGGKWHNDRHWRYNATVLGTDEHGIWLGVAKGTRVRKAKRVTKTEHAFVRLVPHPTESWEDGTWMLPGFWIDHPAIDACIDVTTPPSLRKNGSRWIVEYDDLDLDLVIPVDEPAWIDDEEEFQERSCKHGWPEWLIERTRATADELLALSRQDQWALCAAAQRWRAAWAAEQR